MCVEKSRRIKEMVLSMELRFTIRGNNQREGSGLDILFPSCLEDNKVRWIWNSRAQAGLKIN